jgi:hypothetical protein
VLFPRALATLYQMMGFIWIIPTYRFKNGKAEEGNINYLLKVSNWAFGWSSDIPGETDFLIKILGAEEKVKEKEKEEEGEEEKFKKFPVGRGVQ